MAKLSSRPLQSFSIGSSYFELREKRRKILVEEIEQLWKERTIKRTDFWWPHHVINNALHDECLTFTFITINNKKVDESLRMERTEVVVVPDDCSYHSFFIPFSLFFSLSPTFSLSLSLLFSLVSPNVCDECVLEIWERWIGLHG